MMPIFANLLQAFRIRANLSKLRLAELARVDRNRLADWEVGKRVPRDYSVVQDLAEQLNLSADERKQLEAAYTAARSLRGVRTADVLAIIPAPISEPLPNIPVTQASLENDTFVYDLFVSYCHKEPDRTWVRKTLIPGLEAKGVCVCVDYHDFRLGIPLILEIARAVEESRYTLAVLSPAYLASTFTELETVLAEQLGLEQSQRRLLPVMREACTPRLGIRARFWLDMTNDDEFEKNLARLVYEMRLHL